MTATLHRIRDLSELAVPYDPQLRPILLRLEDRRLPLPGQILEAVGIEQRLLELAPLKIAKL
jgi:hypothetical protein